MVTLQEAFEGARWVMDQEAAVRAVYFKNYLDGIWYAEVEPKPDDGDRLKLSTLLQYPIQRRDAAQLREYLLRPYGSHPVDPDLVRFSREFVEAGQEASNWLEGASWVVASSELVTHVSTYIDGISSHAHWVCYTKQGRHCTLSTGVRRRQTEVLLSYVDQANCIPRVRLPEGFPRDFLMGRNKCQEVVVLPPEPPKSALPLDLQQAQAFQGLSFEVRRQAHVDAILDDMMTRTAPPRYR